MSARSKDKRTALLLTVGLLSWLVPGAGFYVLKEKKRAIIVFVTIALTFCTGLYIGSIAVVNPRTSKLAYVAQIMNSPIVATLGHVTRGRLLLSIDLEYQSDLDNGVISKDLRQQFKDNNISLSQDAAISTRQRSYKWLITGNKRSYIVKKEYDELNIYTDYPVYGKPNEVGQIYTSISGLLNLLCIVNAVYLAHQRRTETAGD